MKIDGLPKVAQDVIPVGCRLVGCSQFRKGVCQIDGPCPHTAPDVLVLDEAAIRADECARVVGRVREIVTHLDCKPHSELVWRHELADEIIYAIFREFGASPSIPAITPPPRMMELAQTVKEFYGAGFARELADLVLREFGAPGDGS